MEESLPKPYLWLDFALKLPTAGEFALLVLYTGGFILLGKLIKSHWDRNNETVPIPVALGMGVAMLAGFFLLIAVLYEYTVESTTLGTIHLGAGHEVAVLAPDSRYISILAWCMIAVLYPLFYYGLILVNSFASRAIDRVSPFGMQINEPSEFAEARRMALRGNVDGAVKRYRAYLENTEDALFEAARLLKSEDRFAEAAALFQEIGERFYGKKLIWAEALYQLAKIKAESLHQTGEAMGLLAQVIERTSDSRYGQLAKTELVRMENLYGVIPPVNASGAVAEDGDDPFFEPQDERHESTPKETAGNNGQHQSSESIVDEDMVPVPSIDPFFAAAQRNREIAAAETKEKASTAPSRKRTSKKKTPTKTSAKKKTVAKKKATVKKKATAKKTTSAKRKPKSNA